ncbi:conserved Plasmodium protein, unknown function [Plasmodium relictum]|uniref:Ribosomal RNA-processing protein 12-like conserved domain-containing protein n=1 Tax=Plasmodium relictum TaxID=85471 RepID=A0A1J1H9D7_PLARL|nr:conserved Plasmodium protein, unknown function [Plasmodium relictum]CRH00214.1 conserved Plasmodium protein, unknown function [Plasmodium relictum]
MDKFKKCRKRNFRSLKKSRFIKKRSGKSNETNSNSQNDFITNIIIKYLNNEKNEKKNNVDNANEFITENVTENLKEKLFMGKKIVETDLINNCLTYNKNETLKKISYKILYHVMKTCIDHENVLMKIEELGFTAENIKDKNDEKINICSKYKIDTFFNYIYKNLQVIKTTKNFNLLCKLINLIKSVIIIIPYIYKIKFLFYFCSILNIYQKHCEDNDSTKSENVNTKSRNNSIPFNMNEEEFLNLFFDIINELVNLKDNYNNYDDNFSIFNYFILRWILVYFKNKYHFFLKKKMNSLIKSKYIILLFSILKHLHESTNFNLEQGDEKRKNMYNDESKMEESEQELSKIENLNDEVSNFYKNKYCGERNILENLCINQNLKNEKIIKNRDSIKNMIENFYNKVDMNIEKSTKEVKDTMNTLTQNIFITVFNLFPKCHILHKHMVLLYFSFHFLKLSKYDYSYFIIFNSFQFLNKLLTVHNFLIHSLIFLAIQEVLTLYENVIIHLYKEKNDLSEEFYQFFDKFNNKHQNLYMNILTRVWNLYMLLISDEYMKKETSKLDEKKYPNINTIKEQMNTTNTNKLISVIKINNLEFSNEYKEFLLNNIDETYKNNLTNCLSKSFRIIGLGFFLEEYYFFCSKELLSKDIFILNRIFKDSNKTYYGGNFKFLMNFFYPLLICYIDLYEKEEYAIKKQQFLTYIKNLLIHFSCSLNDCINLYYFLSTNIEDFYVLATKFINCNDFNLLPLFINFFERFYLSTMKIKQEHSFLPNFSDNKMKDIKCKYTNISIKKNYFFLEQVTDNLLKILLPRFISILSVSFEKKFSFNKEKDNNTNIHATIENFSNLIHLCLHFSSNTNFDEILTIVEQLISRNEIEKEIFSLISMLTVMKIFIPFFSFDQINMCSFYFIKLIQLINFILNNKLSNFSFINTEEIFSKINNNQSKCWNNTNIDQMNTVTDINYNINDVNHISDNNVNKLNCLNGSINNINTLNNNNVNKLIHINNDINDINQSNNNNNNNNNNLGNINSSVDYNISNLNNFNVNNLNNINTNINDLNQFNNQDKYLNEANKCNINNVNNLKNKYKLNDKKNKNSKKEKSKNINIGIKSNFIKNKKKDSLKKEKLRKMKIKKNIKEDIEKLKFTRILIFDNVSVLYKYFGNIFLKKKKMLFIDNNTKRRNNSRNELFYLSNNEQNILNNIYVDNKIIENKLPLMMQKESIFLFFENIPNYNINKYIKKFYLYINSLTFYLKECKNIDISYCSNLFFEILPVIMKSLFYINKKFTSKLRKNCLFENIIEIGMTDIKKLFFHITPGLLLEENNCKKIAMYILYLLIKNYKIEYDDQVKLFDICLALSNTNENNLLKTYLKFLLSCMHIFNNNIILNNINDIIKLINDISYNKSFRFLVEKFLLKLNGIFETDVLKNYLSKLSRKFFNKLIKKKNDENNKENKNKRGRIDKKKTKIQNGYMSSSSEAPSFLSYSSSPFSSDESDKECNLDDIKEEHTIDETLKKKDKKNILINKNKRTIKSNSKSKNNKKKKNENKNLKNFFETLKKSRGEKETDYIKSILKQILTNKKRERKNKNYKLKYNQNISNILNNLQKNVLKKNKNLDLSLTKQKEINDLFGEQYFIKQNKNKVKKNIKENVSDSYDEDNFEINNEGKIVIPLENSSSYLKNKKRDELLNKKYKDMNEKQNIHSKFKLNRKSKNHKKKDIFVTADKNLYKSKKGEGDIIKKNKLLPYSYVALKPIMTKDKFRAKTLHAFRSIKNSSKRKNKKKN